MREWITGRNPVYEALRAKRRQVFRLLVAQGTQEKGRLVEILRLAAGRKIQIERSPRAQLDSFSSSHQGVALEASGYPYCAQSDILDKSARQKEPPFLLILDALQDPQNLGTLLRTAEAVGVQGVLLPLRHTATITPAVVHASSGASEHLWIAQVNLAQAIKELKENDIWVVGLDGGPGSREIGQVRLDGPIAIVVGNEGEGMRQLTRDSCDILARLPMRGQVDSLNAAVAGSVALYFTWSARQFAKPRTTDIDVTLES